MTATPNPTRRPGLTLTEALVAMFVAAIGLLALLTLFPLGALQMAQALKDERTAQTALQADALMRFYWRTEVVEPTGPRGFPNGPDPLTIAFDNPNYNVLTRPDAMGAPEYLNIYPGIYQRYSATFPDRGPIGFNFTPSFPVFVDPLGWQAREGLLTPKRVEQPWVGGKLDTSMAPTQPLPIPRRSLRGLKGAPTANTWSSSTNPEYSANSMFGYTLFPRALRFGCLLDDLTYDESGSGVPPATGVERQGRYNWAAIVQRPRAEDPNTASLTITVFDGRSPGYSTAGQELVYPRDSGITTGNTLLATTLPNLVVFVPGSTAIRLYYFGERPPISKGRWVMDGTLGGSPVLIPANPGGVVAYDPDNTSFVANATNPPQLNLRHANFYRVSTVTEGQDAVRGQVYLDIELEKPIKPRSDGRTFASPATDWTYYAGTLYVMSGVSEVFEMPPLTR